MAPHHSEEQWLRGHVKEEKSHKLMRVGREESYEGQCGYQREHHASSLLTPCSMDFASLTRMAALDPRGGPLRLVLTSSPRCNGIHVG